MVVYPQIILWFALTKFLLLIMTVKIHGRNYTGDYKMVYVLLKEISKQI